MKNGLCYLDDHLKHSIKFRSHNLLADRYPQNVDLIVYRNGLIYFTDEAKEIIYKNFSDALVESGILFVGSTDQVFRPNDYNLSVFDTFFYKKKQ